ncbi:MAG: molybdenum ABC transporter ATP-binding protein [Planctomycetota bacterium]
MKPAHRFELRGGWGDFQLAATADWSAPITALFGPSGSGKSTVLEALVGLRRDVHGAIEIAGQRVEHLPPEQRGLGWVPQDASLFPHLDLRGNLLFAQGGGRQAALSAASRAAVQALELEPLLDRRATQLSGGERQRAAIARALASEPRLLLLDEPLASLDRPLRARIVPFLAQLPARTGVPMLLVSHDPHEVLALAEQVLVIEAGRITACGPARALLGAAAAIDALEALAAENVFEVAEVVGTSGTLRVVTRGGCSLELALRPGAPQPRRVAIRAEDILLAVAEPVGLSAQNILTGRVTALAPLGPSVELRVAIADESWVARLTPRAVAALGLREGAAVRLIVKAHAVHPCL